MIKKLRVYHHKERLYYPDIFIKSENLLIEVKSKYTFDLHKEKNLTKQQEYIKQGYNFEFKIYNNKGKLII